MDDTAHDLLEGMLSAYPGYVDGRLNELNLERPASFDGVLAAGAAWLRANLEGLLSLPFGEQRRGPLELFQEAMRFPTDALAGAGVPVVARDPGIVAALPGDVYSLAPASPRQLGEEVWTAHLIWGATKAQSLTRNRLIGLLSGNLMDRSRIGPLVERSGSQLVVWTSYAAETEDAVDDLPDLVLVDLSVPGSLEAIEGWVQAGARVIAYGPHVDRQGLRNARRAGAEQVLARSVFFETLVELFS